MARINLLPWREEQRRERQRQFMSSLLMTAILGVVLVFHGVLFSTRKSLINNSEMNWSERNPGTGSPDQEN